MTSPLDAVPAGVLRLSGDLHLLDANRGLATMVGRSRDELVGASIDILLTTPSRILFQTHVYPALRADGRVEEMFLTLAGPDGTATPVLLNAVRDETAQPIAYDGLLVRVQARTTWEKELLAATRALQQERAASQRLADDLARAARVLEERHELELRSRAFRDAFVGVVSHELRTPITTIYGMSHVVRQRHATMTPEALGAAVEDIAAEADRLRRLTEDLLVLSRAEGGQLVVASEPVAIRHVVRAAVESERVRAPRHRFEVEASPGVPFILGEDTYVEQVIANFLSNAVKYSPPDTTIHVSVRGEADGVAVRVIDEGPGLPEGRPEQLFELFHRAPGVIGHASGAGIGLFVCRELIGAMGGRIWATDAPIGAEFGFWLPAADEDGRIASTTEAAVDPA